MFLLKANHPERFRYADMEGRSASEALPPPAPPVGNAVERLAPVTPAEPHLLTPPDQMKRDVASARRDGERLAAAPDEGDQATTRWPPDYCDWIRDNEQD